jgi:hypothetical protein
MHTHALNPVVAKLTLAGRSLRKDTSTESSDLLRFCAYFLLLLHTKEMLGKEAQEKGIRQNLRISETQKLS